MAAGDQLWQRGISYGSGGSVMAVGDQLWQRGISYGSNKWSRGSFTAATSDPGGSVIGGMGYCTTE